MPSSPSPYVTLISSDGFEFIVRRESAYVAGPIKKMLDPTSLYSFPRNEWNREKIDTLYTTAMEGGFAGTMKKKTDKTWVLQAISRKRLVAAVFSAISSMLLLPFPFIHLYSFLSLSLSEGLSSPVSANAKSYEQRCCPRKSLRISLLQRKIKRTKGCPGHGFSSRTVSRIADGGRLFAK